MGKRDYAVDAIRLISILGVVIIHVTTAFTDRAAEFSPDFFSYHLINQLFRFAVPLFFLISGFLLAAKYPIIKSPIEFYKKRLSKILLPYVVWSIIYYLLVFADPNKSIFTNKFGMNLLTGNASYQLYFIPAIIILYLLFPIFINLKKYFLTYWFIIVLVLLSAVPTYYFYLNQNIPLFPPIRIALYNLLPFIVGMFAASRVSNLNKLLAKKTKTILVAIVVFAIAIFAESTFMFTKTFNADYLKNQWRASVELYGIFVGALIYYLYPIYLKKFEKVVSYFASYAIGVFFVHVAILTFVLRFIDKVHYESSMEFVPTLFVIVVGSFIFSIVVSKVKILNLLLGLRG